MKITKEDLKAIIKEEAQKFKKRIELENELSQIQKQLNEVEAGSLYSLPDGTKKYDEKFENLNATTIKEDEMDVEFEEEGLEEEYDMESEEEMDANLEEILAEIMSEDGALEEMCDEAHGNGEGDFTHSHETNEGEVNLEESEEVESEEAEEEIEEGFLNESAEVKRMKLLAGLK